MAEFSLHSLVNNLIQHFNSSTDFADAWTHQLQKNIVSPRSTTLQSNANLILEELLASSSEGKDQQMCMLARKVQDVHKRHFFNSLVLIDALRKDPTLLSALNAVSANNKTVIDKLTDDLVSTGGKVVHKHRTKTKGLNLTLPPQPNWLNNRKHMTLTFQIAEETNWNGLPKDYALIEKQIIQDLLFCLCGILGEIIIAVKPTNSDDSLENGLKFEMHPELDPALRELANRILPLASYYNNLQKFVEAGRSFTNGSIYQAFSSAIRNELVEYMVLICNLEQQFKCKQLSLQALWYHVQPSLLKLQYLNTICQSLVVGHIRGGAILSFLHSQLVLAVDEKLVESLFKAAAVPFEQMLGFWLYQGCIVDPYGEFMISENKRVIAKTKGMTSLWHKRFTLRQDLVPEFLKPVADSILKCGSYLNILYSCGCYIEDSDALKVVSLECKYNKYLTEIDSACQIAGNRLLQLLNDEYKFGDILKSVKGFLLLEVGDFFVTFLDLAERELDKQVEDVVVTRVQSLLELSVKTSSGSRLAAHEYLCADFLHQTLEHFLLALIGLQGSRYNTTSMLIAENSAVSNDNCMTGFSGLDSFCLDIKIQYPLTLVLHESAMTQYQILFRRLFKCKLIERKLNEHWIDNKNKGYSTVLEAIARTKMLAFLSNYLFFATQEVIEPNWHKFCLEFSLAQTIDNVLLAHQKFLDNSVKDCLLTEAELVRYFEQALSLCSKFLFDVSLDSIKSTSKEFDTALSKLLDGVRQLGCNTRETSWLQIAHRLDLVVSE